MSVLFEQKAEQVVAAGIIMITWGGRRNKKRAQDLFSPVISFVSCLWLGMTAKMLSCFIWRPLEDTTFLLPRGLTCDSISHVRRIRMSDLRIAVFVLDFTRYFPVNLICDVIAYHFSQASGPVFWIMYAFEARLTLINICVSGVLKVRTRFHEYV